jgi:hypothetical protein
MNPCHYTDDVTPLKVSNFTVQIKGWPGPIIHQKDLYPPNMVSPKTAAELQKVAGQRFNSELSFFLLVAGNLDYWIYSWCGARFPTEIYTRGCHWIPRMFA